VNLEDVRLFLTVARAGSFSAAARQTGVPKGTLSRRVAGFEKALGAVLLHRTTRQLVLTEAGERLLAQAGPLVDELQGVGEALESLQREVRGTLRLQLPAELLADDLTDIVTRFAAAHPRVTMCCSHYTGRPSDPGAFDLTLLGYEWRLPDADWIATPLMSLPQAVYAAPGLLPGPVATLDALAEVPAVLPAEVDALWHFRVGGETRTLAMQGRVYLDSPAMRLRATELGAGIAKLPVATAGRAVAAGRLVEVALPARPLALSIAVLYRSRAMPARARAFMASLQTDYAMPARHRSAEGSS
jgi:DNA-binding transcriptional LysR family regulator